MSIEIWLAFVAASAVLLAIPGPTVLLVISYALGHGELRRPGAFPPGLVPEMLQPFGSPRLW